MLSKVANATRWYLMGLFHPLALMLGLVVVVALMESVESQGTLRGFRVVMVLEWLLYPLYFLQAALHVIRDPRTTLFELTLIRSWWMLFASRITAFTISLAIVYVPCAVVLYVSGLQDFIIPFTLKNLWYVSVVSIAMLLYSRRGALAFLIIASIVLPMAVIGVINTLPPSHSLSAIESIVLYFISPITLHINNQLLAMEETILQFTSLLISLALLAASALIFVKEEVDF